jgi:hypothetical protein
VAAGRLGAGPQLGLEMEEPSGHSDSGQVSFAASQNYNYHWGEGLGPGAGPVAVSWTVVPLDAAGHPVAFTPF